MWSLSLHTELLFFSNTSFDGAENGGAFRKLSHNVNSFGVCVCVWVQAIWVNSTTCSPCGCVCETMLFNDARTCAHALPTRMTTKTRDRASGSSAAVRATLSNSHSFNLNGTAHLTLNFYPRAHIHAHTFVVGVQLMPVYIHTHGCAACTQSHSQIDTAIHVRVMAIVNDKIHPSGCVNAALLILGFS